MNLKKYLFQTIGLIINGDKYIYINAFPMEDNTSNWEEDVIFACDGGTSYWGALFSFRNYTFSQLAFNGPPIRKD